MFCRLTGCTDSERDVLLQEDEAAVVKETKPLQSARFNNYIKAGIEHVEAFALLSDKDASDYFDLVMQSVRKGEETKVAAELFVKEMWYTVRAWHGYLSPLCTCKQKQTPELSLKAAQPVGCIP